MATKRTNGLASVLFMGKNLTIKGKESLGVVVPIETGVPIPSTAGFIVTSCIVDKDIPIIKEKGLWNFFTINKQNDFMRKLVKIIDEDSKSNIDKSNFEPVNAAEIKAEKEIEVIPISFPESEEILPLTSHQMEAYEDTLEDNEEEYSYNESDTLDTEVIKRSKKGTKKKKRSVSMIEKKASNDEV